jgi:hypothetical protein
MNDNIMCKVYVFYSMMENVYKKFVYF